MKDRTFPTAIWSMSWDDIVGGQLGCVQGVASLNRDRGLRVEIPFGRLLDDGAEFVVSGERLPSQLDWLYGFSQEGQWLALAEVKSLGTDSSCPGASRQTLTGSRLLLGKERFDPSALVSEVEMTIKGLTEWLGKSPIKMKSRLKDGRREWFSVDVDLTDNANNVVLLDDDDIKVSIYHRVARKNGIGFGVDIEHCAVLRINFPHPVELEKARTIALRLDDFLSFCFGFYAEPLNIIFGFEDGNSAELLLTLIEGKSPERVGDWRMPLRYSEIEDRVGLMLERWLNADGWLRNSTGLLVSLLFKNWRFPVDLEAIASAQMLEALSKAGVDIKSMSDNEFADYKSVIRTALDNIEDKRLSDMAKERIHLTNLKGQGRLLKDLLARHGVVTSFILGDSALFVKDHVGLRNDITHRDPKLQTAGAELFLHSKTVLLLGYCIIAEELSLAPETVMEGIERSRFKCGVIEWARNRYPAKSDSSKSTTQ